MTHHIQKWPAGRISRTSRPVCAPKGEGRLPDTCFPEIPSTNEQKAYPDEANQQSGNVGGKTGDVGSGKNCIHVLFLLTGKPG